MFMSLIIKFILSLIDKKENNVLYLKGLPIVGDVKIVCENVGKDMVPSGTEKALDIFTWDRGSVLRITVIREK